MKTFFAISSIVLVTTVVTIAASAPAAPAPPAAPASPAPSPAKIEPKNKSSFTLEAGSRNPFWPIGWKPVGKLTNGAGGEAAGEIPVTAFVVSTITVDQGARFAIINGKTMQEGQKFGLLLGTQTYQILVKKIEDGRVILGRQDEEIIIPLRRK